MAGASLARRCRRGAGTHGGALARTPLSRRRPRTGLPGRSGYTGRVTRPDRARAGTSLLALLTALSLCPLAQAASSAAIAQETARSVRVEGRIVQFWWLPLEYWLAAATERETPAAELETGRRLFRNYLILAVVDTYHSLVSDRAYRPGVGAAVALEEVQRCAGSQFDANVVDLMTRVLQQEPGSEEIVTGEGQTELMTTMNRRSDEEETRLVPAGTVS